MKHLHPAMIMLASLVPILGCAHGGPSRQALDRLVESERAFCRLAGETSVKQAFLQYLSDDAVMLLPRPANGKQAYAGRPASAAGLRWEPSCALISAAGDLGCTFGPWEFRKHRDQDTADAYGHFVSVWQVQPDGQWKVVFDSGISHQRPAGAAEKLRLRCAHAVNGSAPIDQRARQDLADRLLAIDRDVSDSSSAANAIERLLAAMGDDVTMFVESRLPVSGKTAAGEILRDDNAARHWRPISAVVSASGDLGYVYGTATSYVPGRPAGELSYLRVWERLPDGTWNIVVQKTNPVEE